jgi:ribosomal protein S13
VKYAQSVAAAAGVPTTTLVGELDDRQLRIMQEKIAEIEGTVPGDVLTRDSPELPVAVRRLLP